jgi:hypothetical protein
MDPDRQFPFSLCRPRKRFLIEQKKGYLLMKPEKALVSAVFLSLLCCQNPMVPSIPIGTLLTAPEQVEIDGRIYVLETYLWRDFMPGTAPGGSDLMAVLRITAADSQPFPDDLDSDLLWIINGDAVWETEYSGENRPRDGNHLHQLEKIARGGPRWETGIEVQVVVRMTTSDGRSHLLRAANQLINRTV